MRHSSTTQSVAFILILACQCLQFVCFAAVPKPHNASGLNPHNASGTKSHITAGTKPHIIMILADDLGYNDVGYNADQSAVLTPNIDALARQGVILDNYYVQSQCSPSRSQLMTGRYQTRYGLQHNTFEPTRPMCLPLDEVTMADKLKESGYSTHLVGKWHLGFYTQECVPINRGFDSFLGFYTGSEEYYTHLKHYTKQNFDISGYDFREGDAVAWDYAGMYSTYVFDNEAQNIIRSHDPNTPLFLFLSLQAPHSPLEVDQEYRAPYKGIIKHADRKTVAGMISCMDETVGNVVNALKESGLYDNSVILFSSDNGAAIDREGNNWPLRGSKNTLWEGALRTVGFINSPLLPSNVQQTTSTAFIHVSDWFPTFVSTLAGGNVDGIKLDGLDVWNAISGGTKSNREELLHNIDPLFPTNTSPDRSSPFDTSIHAALRKGDWKIITGNPGSDWDWTPPRESDLSVVRSDDPADKHLWLFNINTDPKEENDVSAQNPAIVTELLERLQYYYVNMEEPFWPDKDKNYDPADYGGVWEPWGDK